MSVTEHELQRRAVAPRVTLDYLEGQIASEHYFTGVEGTLGRLLVEGELGEAPRDPAKTLPLGLLTICVLVLKNGFTVVGTSACASAANFQRDIGERIARQDAVRQVWPLLGYELRTQLSPAGDYYAWDVA